MTNFIKTVVISLALAINSISVPAAGLPTLPVDSRITKGTLGCGVTYYMVSNPSAKGYADIAVVRRNEAPSEEARKSLSPGFFSRMKIAPRPDGYMSDNDGSTVFRYENIAFYRPEVLDSTLLYTFDQIAQSRSEQAIIVCGDIDQVELKKKMDIFSMLVPRILVKEANVPDYVWEPSPAPVVTVNTEPGRKVSEISVSYTSARTPYQLMNTPQFLVTDILAKEFHAVVGHRFKRNLRDAGIPVAYLRYGAVTSFNSAGDERYTVTVGTSPEFVDVAMRTISSTLAELDSFGVSETEFADAKSTLLPSFIKRAKATPSREEDVDRCISHFLYGSPLSPRTEDLTLFSRKNVADSTQARLFNRFSSALLEQLSNLSLEYTLADTLDRDEALFYYNLAYLYGSITPSGKDYTWHSRDTLGMERTAPRVRLRSEKAEPVSGGKLWTFSNGMRVAYKQIPGSGMFNYCFIMNGGLSSIENLVQGEGGYIAPMLSMYDAGGLSCSAFHDLVSAKGVTMNTHVGVYSMNINGEAPSSRLSFLLKALLSLSGDRTFNWAEFEAYARSDAFMKTSASDAMDMQMSPGFVYMPVKRAGALTKETARKADKYFQDRFARANDGILVLAGDLDEAVVKKALLKYLGGFNTDRGSMARVAVDRRPIVGTRTVEGSGAPALYVLMDAEYSVTAQTYYTADIAAEALRQSLVSHLAPYGFGVDVLASLETQPQERFQMLVSCYPANLDDLPENVTRDQARALTAVRAAIAEVSRKAPDQADLKAWKALALDNAQKSLSSPEGTVEILRARYAAGKDFSKYQDNINSITPEVVRSFLAALAGGGRIEYIVNE